MRPAADVPSVASLPSGSELLARAQQALDQRNVSRAAVWLTLACRAEPQNADWWFDLASLRWQQKDLPGAARAFQQALRLRPVWSEACGRLAAVCDEMEDLAAAQRWARRAVMLAPQSVAAQNLLAQILRRTGDVAASVKLLRAAIARQPDEPALHWNLAIGLLLAGEYARGWDEYSWRKAAGEVTFDPYPFPRWQGEPLNGKSILVHAEQGLGDEILFATCFDDLLATGGEVTVVCDPRLAPLFSRRWPNAEIIGHQRTKDRALAPITRRPDYQVPAGELPRFFRRSRAEFPLCSQWLSAVPRSCAKWQEHYAALGRGLKIGLAWQAGGKPRERAKRSLGLRDLICLLKTPGIRWINLQYGETLSERAALEREFGVEIHDFPAGDPLVDLDEHAAKISALDAVVTVGNATAHLAGALGVPTFVLLPFVPNWRWGMLGQASPWYRRMRLVRAQQNEAWPLVAARLAKLMFASQPKVVAKCHAASLNFQPIDNLRASFASAERLVQARQWSDAQHLLQSILAHAPRFEPAMRLWGIVAEQTGDTSLARSLTSRAAAIAATQVPSNISGRDSQC